MAFQATNVLPALALDRIKKDMVSVKIATEQIRIKSNSGLPPQDAIHYRQRLKTWRASMDADAATPGLLEYAKAQEDSDTYDVVAEYTATKAEIDAMIDWIANNFPASVSTSQDVDGNIILDPIPSGSLDSFRTRASALEATIV